MLVTQATLEI